MATAGTTILPSEHNPPLEDIGSALTARLMRSGAGGMTGPLKLADGTVALPGLTFTTDPSSGFYKTADGVGVAIGGVKVAEFLAGGVKGARFLGELIPFTCTAAPALCVIPFGQTLLRASYPDLWAQAQIEITAGSALYNNGDGSTTFGILDVRGRIPACLDSAGGTPAGRITTTVSSAALGATGGTQATTLIAGNVPAITVSGGVTNGAISFPAVERANTAGGLANGFTLGTQVGTSDLTNIMSPSQAPSTFLGTGGNASPSAFSSIPPIIMTNYILFAGA